MPPGTTFRGPAEIARFMQGGFNAAAEREEAVYHVNASGLIDRVNEYAAAIPGLPA